MPTTRKVVRKASSTTRRVIHKRTASSGLKKRKTTTYVGGKKAKAKPVRKTAAAKSVKVVKKKKTKGKSRGQSGVGKFIRPYLLKAWADAKAKGLKRPTGAELSKAFKNGRADFNKSMK